MEEAVGDQLKTLAVPFGFEDLVVPYTTPPTPHKYTVDFRLLANGIIIETKGRFVTADRKKHLLVKQQHPDLDIRLVFSNSKARISKQSKTTYAAWAAAKGFLFADKRIPLEWIREPRNERSLAAIKRIMEG